MTDPKPLSVESPPFRARDDAKWKIKENEWYLYGFESPPFRARDDAKWKIKENEWYLYGFDTVKIN